MRDVPLYFRTRDCKTCGDDNKGGYRGYQKPPKVSHCGTCNNCVRGFDHHCFLLNNCVGRRNMRAFVSFLISSCVGSMIYLLGLAQLMWMFSQGPAICGMIVFGLISSNEHVFYPYMMKNYSFLHKKIAINVLGALIFLLTSITMHFSSPN